MTVNLIQLQYLLSGADYPVDKQSLVGHARGKDADDNVLQTLRDLPRGRFHSPDDVTDAVSQS